MDNKEKIIQLLINEYNNSHSNPIRISRNDIDLIQIDEHEAAQILCTLDADGLITAKHLSSRNDFSVFWEITVKTECLEYFKNKNHAKVLNRREWVRTYMPITISSLSLIISLLALIISIYKLSQGL